MESPVTARGSRFPAIDFWLPAGLGIASGTIAVVLEFAGGWPRTHDFSISLMWILVLVAPAWINVEKGAGFSRTMRVVLACGASALVAVMLQPWSAR